MASQPQDEPTLKAKFPQPEAENAPFVSETPTQATQFLDDASQSTQILAGGAPTYTGEAVKDNDATQITQISGSAITQNTQFGQDTAQETVMLTQSGEAGNTLKHTASLSGNASTSRPAPSADGAKYQVLKELGKGGFAWVYLVKNLDLDRLEAIKILNADLAEDDDVTSRFVKEAQISANFNHGNIITIYEVQRRGYWQNFKAEEKILRRHKEPFVYFTMSFVEGDTATNLIRKQAKLSQKQAVSIVIDTCAALDYAHAKNVVHRDIKPDNILVDRRGNGIVMDFGIAKVMDQTRQTAAGTFMGTARYVSPEQAMGRDIDGRSDIYSLGITLYELATGRVPFNSDQWMTVLYQHINEPPPPPDQFLDDMDRDLRNIILKMLEKKQENRFQTAKEVGEALRRVYAKLGGDSAATAANIDIVTRPDLQASVQTTGKTEIAPKTGAPPVRTQHREALEPQASKTERERLEQAKSKSKTGLIAGLLVAAAVIAGAAFFFTRPKPEPALPAPGQMHKLLVSSFPTGNLVSVMDASGKEIPFEKGPLPMMIDLPIGSYKISITNYLGETMTKDALISANIPLARAHAEFDTEDDAFLLEDLK